MRAPRPVPDRLVELAALQEGLVSSDQCDDEGLSPDRRSALVRHGAITRIVRGVYQVGPRPEVRDPASERRRSTWLGLLAVGPEAVAVGVGALAMHRVLGLPTTIAPSVAVPQGMARRPQGPVAVRRFDNGMQTVEVAGRRVATVPWALAQAVPELPRGCAVALMDSALHLGLIDERELDRAHHFARGRRGVARTHEWWCLADGRAESPLESEGRLDCLDKGVPPDELQVELRSPGGYLLGRGDMGWRLEDGRWLIAEMDGREWHEAPDALFRDRSRQNDLVGVAVVLRFTWDDVRAGTVGGTVRRHLRLHRGPPGRTHPWSAQTEVWAD